MGDTAMNKFRATITLNEQPYTTPFTNHVETIGGWDCSGEGNSLAQAFAHAVSNRNGMIPDGLLVQMLYKVANCEERRFRTGRYDPTSLEFKDNQNGWNLKFVRFQIL
jgi:hypothetical protein